MNPKREETHDLNPFKDFVIHNWSVLDEIEGRHLCTVCRKSRKYFCYNCYLPVKALEDKIPKIKLPVKIDVIKHAREIDGKSTAAHAAVLAPDDVRIFTYPCIPDYGQHEKVVLVFPGKNAMSIEDLFQSLSKSDEPCPKRRNLGSSSKLPITRAVFIDSTWNQTRGIYKDQRLRALPCVVLKNRVSQFWRHQNGSPRWYLATIEAIHQFLIELHNAAWSSVSHDPTASAEVRNGEEESRISNGSSRSFKDNNSEGQDIPCKSVNNSSEHGTLTGPYSGEYDNLLFFFCYMYSKIHTLYKHEDLRAYKRPLQ